MSVVTRDLAPPSLSKLPSWVENHNNLRGVLGYWTAEGYLAPDRIMGAHILDFGGGGGSLALLLLERGAASVTVVDPDLSEGYYCEHYSSIPQLSYFKGVIQDLDRLAPHHIRRTGFDLVIASSVTEHVMDLPECLAVIRAILIPGGTFFTAHDNYYHPSGAHDNFMLRYGPKGYAYAGPKCWTTPQLCETSRQFRHSMAISAPWSWDERTENALTPQDCTACPFYKRARPWAHLLQADDFPDAFRQPFFSTGVPGSGLNKITPFMLRQYVVESGLELELFHRHWVPNEPPAELLGEPHWHNPVDLRTLNILVRARKRQS